MLMMTHGCAEQPMGRPMEIIVEGFDRACAAGFCLTFVVMP